MINANQAFITAVNSNSRTFRAKILKAGVEIPCAIQSLSISKGAFGDQVLNVGGVYSSQLTLIADNLSTSLENEDISIQIGVLTDPALNTFEYITVGYWTVTKVRATTLQSTLTGLGYIATKLNGIMPDVVTQTLANIASAITTVSGVSISFMDSIDSTGVIVLPVGGLTCRDALEIITGVTGGFATENASGGIEIHKFQIPQTQISATPGRSIEPPQLADDDFDMTGISVTGAGGTWSSGSPIRQSYDNPYMTQDLFSDFASNIVGYTFRPGIVQLSLGDPRIEPWDCLEVTDLDSNTYDVPCHQIIHTFDGGVSSQIISVGESETEPEVRTPIMKRLDTVAEEAAQALQDAEDAIDAAAAVAEYFWFNSTDSGAGEGAGAHITQIPQADFIADPTNGGGNLLLNSTGIAIRDGTDELLTIDNDSLDIYSYDSVNNTYINATSIGASSISFLEDAGEISLQSVTGLWSGNALGLSASDGVFLGAPIAYRSSGRGSYAVLSKEEGLSPSNHFVYLGARADRNAQGSLGGSIFAGIDIIASYSDQRGIIKLYGSSIVDGNAGIYPGGILYLGMDYDASSGTFVQGSSALYLSTDTDNIVVGNTSHNLVIRGANKGSDASYILGATGNMSLAGSITVENHASKIGTTWSNSGSKSVSNSTSYSSLSSNIPLSAGTYALIAQANFAAGTGTGVRALRWYVVGDGAISHSLTAQYATSGFTGRVQSVAIVSPSSDTNYRIDCFHSTGGSVTVDYNYRIVRIA